MSPAIGGTVAADCSTTGNPWQLGWYIAGQRSSQAKETGGQAARHWEAGQADLGSNGSTSMGLTYFKRYRMEIDLGRVPQLPTPVAPPYTLSAWSGDLVAAHAEAKYSSFCFEIDANVFPCLGNREGCHRLMSEISRRDGFLPRATWLLECTGGVEPAAAGTLKVGSSEVCGTVQGVRDHRGFGAIQNLGITPGHRGRGLGTALLFHALQGFEEAGLRQAYLEVTAQNVGAVRLYQRLGFRIVRTVYKAADVAYA